MEREITSDAGTPMLVTASKSGTRIYFSNNLSRGRACWDTITQEWIPIKQEVGPSIKDKIATAFNLIEAR